MAKEESQHQKDRRQLRDAEKDARERGDIDMANKLRAIDKLIEDDDD